MVGKAIKIDKDDARFLRYFSDFPDGATMAQMRKHIEEETRSYECMTGVYRCIVMYLEKGLLVQLKSPCPTCGYVTVKFALSAEGKQLLANKGAARLG
jgi:Zn finger protein HypA/HybF involved in hydrogenase expression